MFICVYARTGRRKLHAGIIECWSSITGAFPEDVLAFRFKLDTDLFSHAQAKTVVRDIAVTRDGRQFATFSDDR